MEPETTTKHHWEILQDGRSVVSNTAEDMAKRAIEYFKWVDTHPIKKVSKIKSGKEAGKEMVENLPRAYNIKALCLHLGIEEEYLRDIREMKDKNSEYYLVISRILYVIYCQQYELAAVGELNPIFTSHALNMDKEETPNTPVEVKIIGGLPSLSRNENQILEKLELEQSLTEKTVL